VERVVLHFDALLRHGCSNPAHIAENHDIFDFELSDDEMARIASLNRNEKHDRY
jgi:diketogulonate reductase-like aldo/keto reductase